jgi:phosphoesterase RecJ-like protein
MIESKLEWERATHLIREASSILIVTHVKPDGDAIGSMVGLAHALRGMGKQVDTAVDEGVPGFLKFLPGTDNVYPKLTTGKWDVMISTDASDEERTGEVGAYGREHADAVINLDHHVTNLFFGNVFLVMVEAVSSTEVVYYWLHYMNIDPQPRAIALSLLTGLVTDTIGFRTSNVRAETLGIAQELMQGGVSLTEIIPRTLESKPYSAIRLWSQALQSIELDEGVVSVNITQADMKQVGLDDASDSGLVSLLNQIDEAMVAVIFFEMPDDKVKLSLRSKRGYDVGSVAMALGGGGHTQASGATIEGTLDAVRERVLPMLKQAVEEGEHIIA